MSTFRQAPSQRRQPRPTATWLVLGTTRAGQVARDELHAHILPVRGTDHVKRYHPEQVLAVKAYVGGPNVCKVNVTGAERVSLGSIDYATARELGYVRVDEFRYAWVAINDEAWWIRALGDEHGPGLSGALGALDDRFASRWADRDVWLLRWTLDKTERPRLLAQRSEELYTDVPARALKDEPAALTEAEHETHVAKRAEVSLGQRQALYDARRAALAERETIGERLDRLIRENAAAGLSTSKEVRVVEKRLAALEQQIRRPAA